MKNRCLVCGWPLVSKQEDGCIPGDCSYRPQEPAEQAKIDARRQQILRVRDAVKAAWDAHGEVPFPLYQGEAQTIAEQAIRAYELT